MLVAPASLPSLRGAQRATKQSIASALREIWIASSCFGFASPSSQ
jgi:chloramphenicol 3-O-phosphotransferase